jgi:hypothetical protein
MHYLFETQVSPLSTIRRERILPAPGEVVVRIGDRVEPTQVIARAELPGDFRILQVARLLDIPGSQVKRYLRIKLGDTVQQGQIIAKRGLGKFVESPIDGMMTASGAGRVLIEASPLPFELRAYIPGTITNIAGAYGAIIETTGAIVQGVWGAGGESFGVLKRLVKGPDKSLRARDIDPSCHGTIIIGGLGLNESVIERAEELQVQGIVTGGFHPGLIPKVKDLQFPIVVTEGIGALPMSAPIFNLLTTNEGREAAISGRLRTRWGITRPEVVIPLPADTVPSTRAQPGSALTAGARVRVVRAPYVGKAGTIVALPAHARYIETKARVRGAEVKLEEEERPIFIPLANLEVLR